MAEPHPGRQLVGSARQHVDHRSCHCVGAERIASAASATARALPGDLPPVAVVLDHLRHPAGTADQSRPRVPVPGIEVGLQEDPEPTARHAREVDRGRTQHPYGRGPRRHRPPGREMLGVAALAGVEVGRHRGLAPAAGRPAGRPARRSAWSARPGRRPRADPGPGSRPHRGPGRRRRSARPPSTSRGSWTRSCTCRRPDRCTRCDRPGRAAPSSPTSPSSGRCSPSRPTTSSSAAWSAADTTSETEVLYCVSRPSASIRAARVPASRTRLAASVWSSTLDPNPSPPR